MSISGDQQCTSGNQQPGEQACPAAEVPDVTALIAPSVTAGQRENVRLAVYLSFSNTGQSPTLPWVVREGFVTEPEARRALIDLHHSRDLVLDKDLLESWNTGQDFLGKPYMGDTDDHDLPLVILAHPFSGVNLGFSVMGKENIFWGGCAWDAFALPHLLPWESPCLVATRCPGCRAPIAVDVSCRYPPLEGRDPRQRLSESPTAPTPPPGPIAHFATPMEDAWNDVVKTCSMQNLFCSTHCVSDWCRRERRKVGYIMDIDTLWRLASDWYTGRTDPDYKRREPSEAKDYFRKAGLKGSFWGLEKE